MDKKGANAVNIFFWICIGLLVLGIYMSFNSYHSVCKIGSDEAKFLLFFTPGNWTKQNIFSCERALPSIVELPFKTFNSFFGTKSSFNDILGFLGINKSFYDFVYPDFFPVGLLIGLWLYVIVLLMVTSRSLSKGPILGYFIPKEDTRGTWVYLLGSQLWKIIPVAVAYGILMQIPLLNTFIDIITLTPLFTLNVLGHTALWVYFLRSFLLAFYFGLLPSALQAYQRYKLKQGYENAIIRERYNRKMMKEMSRG